MLLPRAWPEAAAHLAWNAGTHASHIVVPEDLVSPWTMVGARRRSEFFAAAAAEKLTRARLAEAARAAAGSLADTDIPSGRRQSEPADGSRLARPWPSGCRIGGRCLSRSLLDTTALIDFSRVPSRRARASSI